MSDANGLQLAKDFLSSLDDYTDPGGPKSGAKSADKPIKLATVDPAYSGTGNAKVLFEGETVMGLRAYVTLLPVVANDRVALIPVGHSYLIVGTLGSAALRTALSDIATLKADDVRTPKGVVPSSVVVTGAGATGSAAADGTVSFAGATTISLNAVFDGTGGDIYQVFLSIVGSGGTATDVLVRLRNAGADISAANYEDDRFYRYSGGLASDHLLGSNSVQVMAAAVGASWAGAGHLTINSPNKPNVTGIEHRGRSKGVTDGMTIVGFAHYWNTAQADGLTIITTQFITGSVKVVKVS